MICFCRFRTLHLLSWKKYKLFTTISQSEVIKREPWVSCNCLSVIIDKTNVLNTICCVLIDKLFNYVVYMLSVELKTFNSILSFPVRINWKTMVSISWQKSIHENISWVFITNCIFNVIYHKIKRPWRHQITLIIKVSLPFWDICIYGQITIEMNEANELTITKVTEFLRTKSL